MRSRLKNTPTYALASFLIGALPAVPIILISSFFQDRPAFWIWPMFAAWTFVLLWISDPIKEHEVG